MTNPHLDEFDLEFDPSRGSVTLSRGRQDLWEHLNDAGLLDASEFHDAVAALERKERNELRRRKRLIDRLREQGEKLNLLAWGVLESDALPPEQYVAFEQVLTASKRFAGVEHLCLDFDYDPGWRMHDDAKGTILISAHDARVFMVTAGADTEKLMLLLELHCERSWSMSKISQLGKLSTLSIGQVLQGQAWLASHANGLLCRFDNQALRAVGRTAEPLRWALIHQLSARSLNTVGLRGLNWAFHKEAKRSPAVRFASFPPAIQWKRLFGFRAPPTLRLSSLIGFKVGALNALCPLMGLRLDKVSARDVGSLQPLFNLVRLFGNVEAIRRYVASRGKPWDKKGLHDAGQFTLPSSRESWTPELWAPLCLRHPELTSQAGDFPKLESRGVFPRSPNELRREKVKLTYPAVPKGFEDLAELCISSNLTGKAFETYLDFWQSAKVKTAEFLPQVRIRGEELGLGAGWEFSKLAPSDYRGPLLGQLTGCCQHLSGAGSASAVHGVESPYSGFYIVTHNGKVVAQSWAWRNKTGGLVLDSVESVLRAPSDLQQVFALYKEAAARIPKASLGVSGVYIGATNSGITDQVARALLHEKVPPAVVATVPFDSADYFDGLTHVLVAGKSLKRAKLLPKVEGYQVKRHNPSQHDFDTFALAPFIRRPEPDYLPQHLMDEYPDDVRDLFERRAFEGTI